jgi:hypothetical protein
VPLDDGQPEFGLYVSRTDGTLDLLWSEVLCDGRDVSELAQDETEGVRRPWLDARAS